MLNRIFRYAQILAVILFFLLLIQSAYVYYNRQYRDAGVKSEAYSVPAVRYKTLIISVLGFLFAGSAAYYSSTLYSLDTIISDADTMITAMSSFNTYSQNAEDNINKAVNSHYLKDAKIMASFLSRFPEYQNKPYLTKISNIYSTDHIVIYEMNGKQKSSSNSYTGLNLYTDTKNGMTDLIHGRPYVSLSSEKNPWGSGYIKKIGVLMTDAEENPSGIIEVDFNSTSSEKLKEYVSVDKMFGDVVSSGNRRVFIINKSTGEFSLTPDKENHGSLAKDHGFSDQVLRPYYTGRIVYNGLQYYVICRELGENYIFCGVPYENVFTGRTQLSVFMAVIAFLDFQIILFLLRKKRKKYASVVYAGKDEKIIIPPELKYEYYNPDLDRDIFNLKERRSVQLNPAGLIKYWKKLLPESKVFTLVQMILFLFGIVLMFSYTKNYGTNSVISYSMNNEISGFNVYSATSILITIVIGVIIVSVILAILTLLAQLLQPRGETICRLLKSTIELFSILIIIYICLARLGFDIKTLVASAGLMGLVIGMGARDLITDILAGLFIIFEGDFQVGDIIDIGNFSGTVREIGIRTTKIVSWNKNIKIVNNRNLSSVINLSERNSFATVDFSVPNSVDATHLEEVLNTELAQLREKYPQLLADPYFKGVQRMANGKLECRVVAEVAERWRSETEVGLNEEIQSILRKNEIPLG